MHRINTSGAVQFAHPLTESLATALFRSDVELLPQVNEVYELELAFYESRILSDEEIIRNGAYFARVGDRLTRHFLMCSGEPVKLPCHSSSRLRSFFGRNQFKTGYGTHGLFPYRGKFHPQMIKGLMNVMGLKPGDTVLDPMMGSGTVVIEATLMGVDSVGIDASPFCCFMTNTKLGALSVPLAPVRAALKESGAVFDYFSSVAGSPQAGRKTQQQEMAFSSPDRPPARVERALRPRLPSGCEERGVYDFLLLAYLDGAGYAERSTRVHPFEQFHAILERYYFVAEKIQRIIEGTESELGAARSMEGDARKLPLEASSVDGIIFSPPYSFAIDYLDNDLFHLRHLGVDVGNLRERMIGLRGRTLAAKYENYKLDMDSVIRECARVLRAGKLCAVVVGTNNNQLGKILGTRPEDVPGIEDLVADLGAKHGLSLLRKMSRQITGMANTMRTEYIVLMQKTQLC